MGGADATGEAGLEGGMRAGKGAESEGWRHAKGGVKNSK